MTSSRIQIGKVNGQLALLDVESGANLLIPRMWQCIRNDQTNGAQEELQNLYSNFTSSHQARVLILKMIMVYRYLWGGDVDWAVERLQTFHPRKTREEVLELGLEEMRQHLGTGPISR